MATYKVLQDIEAEDTLIGPLTLRQCLYAAIGVMATYLGFIVISKHAAFLVVFLLPFMAFGFFFAFPWSKQQSTEIWALAKIRFYFKPRKRIWNQSGVKELVTITVPKNIKKAYGRNLSQGEVTSRLKALADTIDSRGWAVKNVDLTYFTHSPLNGQESESDRLVDISHLPQDVPSYDASAEVDMFDMEHSQVAQKFDTMMSQSADTHRQQIVQQMAQQQPQPPAGLQAQAAVAQTTSEADHWHLGSSAPNVTAVPADAVNQPPTGQASPYPYDLTLPAPVYPGPAGATPQTDVTQMMAPVQQPVTASPAPVDYSNMRIPGLQPVPLAPVTTTSNVPLPPVTAPTNPAILELANNNDLNVATIAREAQARNPEPFLGEVVVSLH